MSQNQLDSRLVGRVLALERGERKPTLETLYRISNALDMPMSVIVAEIEKEIRENS